MIAQRCGRLGACALLLTLAVAACDDDPVAAPNALWPDDFEASWPEVRDCRLSPAAHDGFSIRVFTNPEAEAAYTGGVYPFAEGTLVVKGEYDDAACTTLSRVSVMKKLAPDAAPDRGDWQWQRTDAAGRVLTDMPERSCAGCHSACASRDYACTDP